MHLIVPTRHSINALHVTGTNRCATHIVTEDKRRSGSCTLQLLMWQHVRTTFRDFGMPVSAGSFWGLISTQVNIGKSYLHHYFQSTLERLHVNKVHFQIPKALTVPKMTGL